jgi:hypothetical protein
LAAAVTFGVTKLRDIFAAFVLKMAVALDTIILTVGTVAAITFVTAVTFDTTMFKDVIAAGVPVAAELLGTKTFTADATAGKIDVIEFTFGAVTPNETITEILFAVAVTFGEFTVNDV